MPQVTERILSTVPGTFLAVCFVMGGTYAFLKRRDRVMADEGGIGDARDRAGAADDQNGAGS
jgi:hypothetical protein